MVPTTRNIPRSRLLRLTASGVARLSSFASSRGGGGQKRVISRRSSSKGLDFSTIPCYRIVPSLLVWRGILCSLRQDRADGRRHVAIGIAGGLWIAGFLFPAENLTFRVFGVDYVTFFSECIPIPGKVKGCRRRFAPPAFFMGLSLGIEKILILNEKRKDSPIPGPNRGDAYKRLKMKHENEEQTN